MPGNAMDRFEQRVPPLVVLGVALALVGGSARLPASGRLSFPGRRAVVGVLAGLGGLVSLAGAVRFRRARTTVSPLESATPTALVETGVYAYTRNPMYVGFTLALAAAALAVGHRASFVAVPLFAAYLQRMQIIPEERALRAAFGQPFDSYESRVPRWL